MTERTSFDTPDLKSRVFPFTYRGKNYTAREATAGTAVRYRAASLSGAEMTFGADKSNTLRKMGGLASVENLLVGCCVFDDPPGQKDGNGNDVPVGQAVIDGWDYKIQKRIFAWVKENSDLNEKETSLEELKKQRVELGERIAKLENPEDPRGNS